MSYLTDRAKEIFEKVKPLIMGEIHEDKGPQGKKPEVKSENEEAPAVPMSETKDIQDTAVPAGGLLSMVTAVLNGAGIGLLLGVLLGLAISPVVSGVIGTLSGLLAVLLGTSEKYMSPLKSVRIGAFGFFCVAGIILGMNIRVNTLLLPSRQKMMNDYRLVGFSKQEALDFIAFREFGLVPAGWKGKNPETKVQNPPVQAGKGKTASGGTPVEPPASNTTREFVNPEQSALTSGNVLYSSEIDAGECYTLSLATANEPVGEIRDKFERAGGTWKEMAQALAAGLPEKIYVSALLTMRDCLCPTGQNGKYTIKMTTAVKKINSGQSLEQISQILKDAGGTWKTIVDRVGTGNIPVEYQKSLYLSLIQIFEK
jgi:hypothetical protein